MSAYINDDGTYARIYGTTILSTIKNKNDFIPLLRNLKNFDDIKILSNLHLRIFDIFSQTLASMCGDSCGKIDRWFEENGGSYHPYKYLNYDVILPTHYEAKSILSTDFPQDFEISMNTRIVVKYSKVLLKFDFVNDHKVILKRLVSDLNKLYDVRRGVTNHIVLGHIKKAPFSFKENQLKLLNSLIPSKIYVNYPDIYQYKNVDNYELYNDRMN